MDEGDKNGKSIYGTCAREDQVASLRWIISSPLHNIPATAWGGPQ